MAARHEGGKERRRLRKRLRQKGTQAHTHRQGKNEGGGKEGERERERERRASVSPQADTARGPPSEARRTGEERDMSFSLPPPPIPLFSSRFTSAEGRKGKETNIRSSIKKVRSEMNFPHCFCSEGGVTTIFYPPPVAQSRSNKRKSDP